MSELETDIFQALEPAAGAGAGGLHTDHSTRRSVATSAEHSTCAPEPVWEASVSSVVSDNLMIWHIISPQQCFTKVCHVTGGNSDQVIPCVPFCSCQSLLIIQNWVISLWPRGRRDQKSFTLGYLMLLWLGSLLEVSEIISVCLSKSTTMSGVQTSSDLLDTCLSWWTCPKTFGAFAAFFLWKIVCLSVLKVPTKSSTTSGLGGRITRAENPDVNPGLQATEQHQDLAGFVHGHLQKLNMLIRLGTEWMFFSISLAPESNTSVT